ncbi:hypothetical protein SAMN00777080_1350 [Aquiflexum balticum DSM 16537]|uniref:Uncharacterized protein n=1 Tax=Aquiflexum balticum DSM 16537 TaxID=758820 RepID=A0A1W2H1G4_9BACT|nr:DUF6090 family protein [Aquiflexum balticum]SMD42785.1 hypothetical protein SAMN00777080_1350 [Aquiflexum balticum DSM 16537]
MISLFRKIRQKLLSENRVTRYLVYAIGEILLVVIGILIALSINNWNENRKDNLLMKKYTENLISELKSDLLMYDELDDRNKRVAKNIQSYFAYYNSNQPNLDTLISKRDTLKANLRIFASSTYTIQDLISTGNLRLFPSQTKTEILKSQRTLEEKSIYVKETFKGITSLIRELDKKDDLLFRHHYSTKQHESVRNWRYNLDSDKYLLDNNLSVRFLNLFSFQESVNDDLRSASNELLDILKIL